MSKQARKQFLDDHIEDLAGSDPLYAIAYALLKLAEAQDKTAYQIQYLGNGNAMSQQGAIEAFGVHIGGKLDALTEALTQLGTIGSDLD